MGTRRSLIALMVAVLVLGAGAALAGWRISVTQDSTVASIAQIVGFGVFLAAVIGAVALWNRLEHLKAEPYSGREPSMLVYTAGFAGGMALMVAGWIASVAGSTGLSSVLWVVATVLMVTAVVQGARRYHWREHHRRHPERAAPAQWTRPN